MSLRFGCSMVLALLLPACGGPTPPPDKVPPSARTEQWRPPCQELDLTPHYLDLFNQCKNKLEPPPGDSEEVAAPPTIESEDANYPPRVLLHLFPGGITSCECRANDAIPWRTNIETFDETATFTPAQQEAVFLAEKVLLNATEQPVSNGGRAGAVKQLNAIIKPSPLATIPDPSGGAADISQPSTEPKEGAAVAPSPGSSSLVNKSDSDRRGNRRFGSNFSSSYSMNIDEHRNIMMRRSARFNTEVFSSARAVANFELNAQLNCLPSVRA